MRPPIVLSSMLVALALPIAACGPHLTRAERAESSCWPATSELDFDSFVARLREQVRDNPDPMGGLAPETTDAHLGYLRARVLAGEVVLDATAVDACLARIARMTPPERLDDPGNPCAIVAHPRCPVTVRSPCGDDFDCDESMYCRDAPEQPCRRTGHCDPRARLGGACMFPSTQCELPSAGWDTAYCVEDAEHDTISRRCRNRRFVQSAVERCNADTWTEAGEVITYVCPAPMLCTHDGHCRPRASALPTHAECEMDSECAPGNWCNQEHRCDSLVETRCQGDSDCPPRHMCRDQACAISDGLGGSPCRRTGCADGFVCSSGTCRRPQRDGARVTSAAECASGCAVGRSSIECIGASDPAASAR